MVEYTVYDTRNGVRLGKSCQPDESVSSEQAAVRSCGYTETDAFIAVEVREISDEAARAVWCDR